VVGRVAVGLSLLLAAATLGGWWPLALFTEETITIDLFRDRIRVDATYVYSNPLPLPIRQGLTIPLPPGHEPIFMVLSRDGHPLPLRHLFGAWRFELPLRGNETATVRLRYEQYAPARRATYLLTTTAPWHRPLDRGSYVIHANGLHVLESSYALTHDTFTRRRFMPREDWEFVWR
jgi:hypothetical protein